MNTTTSIFRNTGLARLASVNFLRAARWAMPLAATLVLGVTARAQIAGYDFTGAAAPATFAATTYSTNLDSSSILSRGAGAAASAGSNSFRTTGFMNDGIAITNTDYFQFTLSAIAGKTLSITSVGARFNGTSSYLPATTQFAYSLDGNVYTLIGNATPVTAYSTTTSGQVTYDFSSVAALQNVIDTVNVSIRFYASGSTTTGGFGFYSPASGQDGLDVYGSFGNGVAVPEPATILGGLLLVGTLGWNQRRRLGELASSWRKIGVS